MYYFWFYDTVLWTFCLNILLYNFINRMSKLLFPYLRKRYVQVFSWYFVFSSHLYPSTIL